MEAFHEERSPSKCSKEERWTWGMLAHKAHSESPSWYVTCDKSYTLMDESSCDSWRDSTWESMTSASEFWSMVNATALLEIWPSTSTSNEIDNPYRSCNSFYIATDTLQWTCWADKHSMGFKACLASDISTILRSSELKGNLDSLIKLSPRAVTITLK